ncbi:diguanylate cyclase [bacterium]|nr:diguanylate cyclase [bacterium]
MSPINDDEALFGRESLFRQKLHRLRSQWSAPQDARKTTEEISQYTYLTGAEQSLKSRDANEMERLALLDSVTGLYNQQAILKILDSEVKRAKRYKRPVALLFIEADQYDQIADMAGNLVIDTLMKGLSDLVMKTVRDVDIPSRFSAGCFMVVCPETNAQGALIIADRMRSRIANEFTLQVDRNWSVTASIGYAACPRHAMTADDLIVKGEQAMTRARTAGGDRCESA